MLRSTSATNILYSRGQLSENQSFVSYCLSRSKLYLLIQCSIDSAADSRSRDASNKLDRPFSISPLDVSIVGNTRRLVGGWAATSRGHLAQTSIAPFEGFG